MFVFAFNQVKLESHFKRINVTLVKGWFGGEIDKMLKKKKAIAERSDKRLSSGSSSRNEKEKIDSLLCSCYKLNNLHIRDNF